MRREYEFVFLPLFRRGTADILGLHPKSVDKPEHDESKKFDLTGQKREGAVATLHSIYMTSEVTEKLFFYFICGWLYFGVVKVF